MKIALESTTKVVDLVLPGGRSVPARIWEGHTDTGIAVHCFITRIAVNRNEDLSQFEAELQECRDPTEEVGRAYDLRLFIG